MKQIKKYLRPLLVILLISVGIFLIFSDRVQTAVLNDKIEKHQEQVIETITREEIKQNEEKEVTYDFDSVESINLVNVLSTSVDKAKLPSVGLIAIPSVNIKLSIAKGVSNTTMLYAAGTMKPNMRMGEGNYALASHHVSLQNGESLLFSPLVNVQDGALIYITDLDKVYTYRISRRFEVTPNRVDVIDDVPGRKMITLVTCDISTTKRFIVQGDLVEVTDINNATQEMKEAFSLESKTY